LPRIEEANRASVAQAAESFSLAVTECGEYVYEEAQRRTEPGLMTTVQAEDV
jgi:hypothetical protein